MAERQRRASSLLLLNSYGKGEEEEEQITEEVHEMAIESDSPPAFSLVGYDHDDEDEDGSHNLGENVGRAVINLPSKPSASDLPSVSTPPPSSPLTTTTTITTTTTTTTTTISTTSLRGKTIHASPFRCDALLPPEPPGPVSPDLQENVLKCFAHMNEGRHINDMRYSKKYKNPDILEKLVLYCGVDEIGSNYPQELFNPYGFEPHDYYESIAAEQKRSEEKRTEDRSNRTHIDFTSPTASSSSASLAAKAADDKKRSKWDSMEPTKQQIVGVVTSIAPPPPTTNAYVEYIRDRKKREGVEPTTKDTTSNKKTKK